MGKGQFERGKLGMKNGEEERLLYPLPKICEFSWKCSNCPNIAFEDSVSCSKGHMNATL